MVVRVTQEHRRLEPRVRLLLGRTLLIKRLEGENAEEWWLEEGGVGKC